MIRLYLFALGLLFGFYLAEIKEHGITSKHVIHNAKVDSVGPNMWQVIPYNDTVINSMKASKSSYKKRN